MKESKNTSWKPVEGQLMTRWVSKIDPEKPLPKYPRPQLRRKEWLNLNGLWDYAILPKEQNYIDSFEGKILVPYPIESALSGVKRKLGPKQKLWYHQTFAIPDSWNQKKILLHFGAVDWETTIWINESLVGVHKGGFASFYFEISKYLKKGEDNELILSVWDPTDKGHQEHGKQSLKPNIILYTAVSGIWQTVWLEPVLETYFESLKMIPNIDHETLNLKVNIIGSQKNDLIHTIILEKEGQIITDHETIEKDTLFKIQSPKLWSPDSPYLYDIIVEIKRNNLVLDKVKSYFGMRKIALGRNMRDIKVIELNNKPLFQYGTLDQGYWPDGLYTAPTDDALKYDIEISKELGFNLIRKHVKIETARWYYHCDKIGILVWQDMPNGGHWSVLKQIKMKLISENRFKGKRKDYAKKNYYDMLKSVINLLYNSPSVIVWVPFNEGWGQFDTEKVVDTIRNLDSSRLINNVSGWFDKGVGDIRDIHNYPDPKMPNKLEGRAAVVGEFGGLGLKVEGHMWKSKGKFVYKNLQDQHKLLNRYKKMISKLILLIENGLCAAIYTQITDVEYEINGLLTYDREIIKMDKNKLRELNLSLFRK